MIYFDIDGVLRDLSGEAFPDKPILKWEQQRDGNGIFGAIEGRPSLLHTAPPMEYMYTVRVLSLRGVKITILSTQPDTWRRGTTRWLNRYLPHVPYIYTYHMEEKFDHVKEGDVLIDDYPYFSSYDRVILVDRPYNTETPAPIRVFSPVVLAAILGRREKAEWKR